MVDAGDSSLSTRTVLACVALAATVAVADDTAARTAQALEQRLRDEPHDGRAVRELHGLLMRPNELSRDESMRLREVVRTHARDAAATLVPPDELGERIVISGTVRDPGGAPVAGALVSVFQADARGLYSPSDARTQRMDEPNSRIFGFLRTGSDGHYSFRTVRPGGYPYPLPGRSGDQALVPAHVHLLVEAPGHATFTCGGSSCQLVFADDPRLTPHWREWARRQANPILELLPAAEGVASATFDVTLRDR